MNNCMFSAVFRVNFLPELNLILKTWGCSEMIFTQGVNFMGDTGFRIPEEPGKY
jgi:hypothetical protein